MSYKEKPILFSAPITTMGATHAGDSPMALAVAAGARRAAQRLFGVSVRQKVYRCFEVLATPTDKPVPATDA